MSETVVKASSQQKMPLGENCINQRRLQKNTITVMYNNRLMQMSEVSLLVTKPRHTGESNKKFATSFF
jgi:hypothetical protein